MVVRMFPELHRNRHFLRLAEIVRGSNVIERLELQHEMMQAFGRSGHLRKGDRVVSRIAVEKHNPHLNLWGWGKIHKVAYAHSQQITIEMQTAVKVIDPNYEVSYPLFARFEAGDL